MSKSLRIKEYHSVFVSFRATYWVARFDLKAIAKGFLRVTVRVCSASCGFDVLACYCYRLRFARATQSCCTYCFLFATQTMSCDFIFLLYRTLKNFRDVLSQFDILKLQPTKLKALFNGRLRTIRVFFGWLHLGRPLKVYEGKPVTKIFYLCP